MRDLYHHEKIKYEFYQELPLVLVGNGTENDPDTYYDTKVYATSIEFMNTYPERYSGLDKTEIASMLWGRRAGT